MPGVRWHHSMRPPPPPLPAGHTAHPPPTSKANAGSRGYLSIAERKESQIHSDSAGVILSHHSQPVLCPHVLLLTSSPETFSRLTPSLYTSLPLFIARLLVLGRLLRSPRRVYTPTTFDFSPPDQSSTPSRIRHKLLQCPKRREARCRAARSRRPRHRMYIMQAASQRG
jgi:hypothetical protein